MLLKYSIFHEQHNISRGRALSLLFFGGNCTMKNIKITVKSNTPSEEALKRFADKVMMIYNVSISKEKGA